MKYFLIFFLIQCIFCASSTEEDFFLTNPFLKEPCRRWISEEVTYDSPKTHPTTCEEMSSHSRTLARRNIQNPSTTLLAPTPYYITHEKFCLIPLRKEFSPDLVPTFKDRSVMRFYGRGRTVSPNGLHQRFKEYEQQNQEVIQKSYHWVVITCGGIVGLVSAYPPNPASHEDKRVLEISRILAKSAQKYGLGREILLSLFNHFPEIAWQTKAHPKNTPSIRSRENAGFICMKMAFDKQDNAIRVFHQRPSNDEMENGLNIYFPYSNRTVSLKSLYENDLLKEMLSFSTKHFSVTPLSLKDLDCFKYFQIYLLLKKSIEMQESIFTQSSIRKLQKDLLHECLYYAIFKKNTSKFEGILCVEKDTKRKSQDFSDLYMKLKREAEKQKYKNHTEEIPPALLEHYQNYRVIPSGNLTDSYGFIILSLPALETLNKKLKKSKTKSAKSISLAKCLLSKHSRTCPSTPLNSNNLCIKRVASECFNTNCYDGSHSKSSDAGDGSPGGTPREIPKVNLSFPSIFIEN